MNSPVFGPLTDGELQSPRTSAHYAPASHTLFLGRLVSGFDSALVERIERESPIRFYRLNDTREPVVASWVVDSNEDNPIILRVIRSDPDDARSANGGECFNFELTWASYHPTEAQERNVRYTLSQLHLDMQISRYPLPVVDHLGDFEDVELSWQVNALCAQIDPDEFPEGRPLDTKRICQICPVRIKCLEYAHVHDERFSIWGGLSERERRRLRRRP